MSCGSLNEAETGAYVSSQLSHRLSTASASLQPPKSPAKQSFPMPLEERRALTRLYAMDSFESHARSNHSTTTSILPRSSFTVRNAAAEPCALLLQGGGSETRAPPLPHREAPFSCSTEHTHRVGTVPKVSCRELQPNLVPSHSSTLCHQLLTSVHYRLQTPQPFSFTTAHFVLQPPTTRSATLLSAALRSLHIPYKLRSCCGIPLHNVWLQ